MHKVWIKNIVFIFLFFFSIFAHAQDLNRFFRTSYSIRAENEKKLYFQFYNSNFVKDDEYFGNLIKGYTYIGLFAKPAFVYFPHKNIKITAGAQFLKYSGLETWGQIKPVFQFQFSPNTKVSLILGTLNGNLNHGLEEQIYDFNRYFAHNIEEGAQIFLDYPWLKLDFWVDWEHFISRVKAEQEVFVTGYHVNIPVLGDKYNSKLSIDLQGIIHHKGGQYHHPELILQTLYNSAYGLRYEYHFNTKRRPIVVGVNAWYFGYKDLSPIHQLAFNSGHALNSNIYFRYGDFMISSGFWKSNKYVAIIGNPLFSSISVHDPNYTQPNSKLITWKFSYGRLLYKDISLEFRHEGYWDLYQKKIEYSLGLYLIFHGDFFLTKVSHKN